MSTTRKSAAPSTSASRTQLNTPSADYETIRAIVAGWPPAIRALLIHDLTNTLVKQIDEERPRRKSLQEMQAILSNDEPPPTDEEVEIIIDEHRQEKYG